MPESGENGKLEKGSQIMDILVDNIFWMLYNSWLAVLPVLFGWLFLKVRKKILKFICACLWFIYLPNTLYLFTDLLHVPHQWVRVEDSDKVLLIFQYAGLQIVGFVTFLLSIASLEKLLFNSKWKKERKLDYAIIITINMLVGFGIVLGRTERINSWEVFTAPGNVIASVATVLSTIDLIFLAVLFGLFANFFYFLFRKPFVKFTKRIDKKV